MKEANGKKRLLHHGHGTDRPMIASGLYALRRDTSSPVVDLATALDLVMRSMHASKDPKAS